MASVIGNIELNKLTSFMAMRFLINAPFISRGSKAYFKDQLVGKRYGQVYNFVVTDAAIVEGGSDMAGQGAGTVPGGGTAPVNGLTHSNFQEIKEASVSMKLIPWHIGVNTNAIETVTDENWDKEIAKPNGAKLAQTVVSQLVRENMTVAATASIGAGFQPLAEAGAYLESISSDSIYGFIDPKFQAILTANGQQFQPVGAPNSLYSKGQLGTFQNVEYYAQRFFPVFKVSEAQSKFLKAAKVAGASDVSISGDTISILLTVDAADKATAAFTIKAGTPIKLDKIFACDLLGCVTAEPYAFIVATDVNVAANATTATVTAKCKFSNFADQLATATGVKARGTNVFALENGELPRAADFQNAVVESLTEGTWYMGQVRLDGAFEFETLDKLDASNSESKVGNITTDNVSVTIHENRVVDIDNMTSKTRWDLVAMAGNVDPRAVLNVYAKA